MTVSPPLYNPYPTILQRRGEHDGFVSLCDLGDGTYLMSYQHGGTEETDPSANTIVLRRSTDGVNWGSVEIVHDETPTYAVKGSNLTPLSDGTLLCVYNRTSGPPTVREGVFYLTSDDNGETWTGPTQINAPSYSDEAEGGPIIELASGDLLCPMWGSNSGDVDSFYMTSTDGGDTWGNETAIATGGHYYEPNVVELANGDLLCLMREESGTNSIYKTTSSDGGDTWGAPAKAFDGTGAPRVIQLSNGDAIAIFRGEASIHGSSSPRIVTSDDNGATWSASQLLTGDGNTETYGDIVELSGGRVGLGYGCLWSDGDGSIHYKIMDFADLP